MPSNGINKVILVGNLGSNPEVRQTQNNMTITTLNIATSESWKDKQTGEARESTEWHRCVAFRRTAEIARDYLAKGSKVYVEGKLQTRKWQDQTGQNRYTTEVVISDIQMLDSKNNSGNPEQFFGTEKNVNTVTNRSTPKFDPNAPIDDGDIPF